ncbi:MAG: Flp family type IVb pilin [Halothiobacillaceae bacterium]|nr:MAG: Flp family type IVb pilin [Halothiobacillaceae bacterium]
MLKQFLADESGASVVEYAILAGLLSIAAVAVITVLGSRLEQSYNGATQKMTNAGM